jgi:hypothetical protein
MTEPEAHGLISLGAKFIGGLPAQFLVLCALNVVFVGMLLWFLDKRETTRERALTPIVEQCLKEVPLDVVQRLLQMQRDGK